MKDKTRTNLESFRPNIDPIIGIKHCLDALYSDVENSLTDFIVKNLTYEELIGVLLVARDKIQQLEKMNAIKSNKNRNPLSLNTAKVSLKYISEKKKIGTTKGFIEHSKYSENIIRAILRQSGGLEVFSDIVVAICKDGAGAGFQGFIYYTETVDFFKKNRREIIELIKVDCTDTINDVFDYLCLWGKYDFNNKSPGHIAATVYGRPSGTEEETEIYNALTWYALEAIAQSYCEYIKTL